MNIEKIKRIFNEKGIVKFKIYALDYTIEKIDDSVFIYADLYDMKKKEYKSIDEALKDYKIFRENIESNEDKISNIY